MNLDDLTDADVAEWVARIRRRNGGRTSVIELLLLARDEIIEIELPSIQQQNDGRAWIKYLGDKGYAHVEFNPARMSYHFGLTPAGRSYAARSLETWAAGEAKRSRADVEKMLPPGKRGRLLDTE